MFIYHYHMKRIALVAKYSEMFIYLFFCVRLFQLEIFDNVIGLSGSSPPNNYYKVLYVCVCIIGARQHHHGKLIAKDYIVITKGDGEQK